jgi:hypothetical protein
MRAEIRQIAQWCLVIKDNKILRRIAMAHERDAQSFDAVVNMHACADLRTLELYRHPDC